MKTSETIQFAYNLLFLVILVFYTVVIIKYAVIVSNFRKTLANQNELIETLRTETKASQEFIKTIVKNINITIPKEREAANAGKEGDYSNHERSPSEAVFNPGHTEEDG